MLTPCLIPFKFKEYSYRTQKFQGKRLCKYAIFDSFGCLFVLTQIKTKLELYNLFKVKIIASQPRLIQGCIVQLGRPLLVHFEQIAKYNRNDIEDEESKKPELSSPYNNLVADSSKREVVTFQCHVSRILNCIIS